MTSDRVLREILSKLTLDEKLSLCYGDGKKSIHAIPSQGIRAFSMNDGPRGIRIEGGKTSTALPCGTSLACTFSREAAFEYGKVLGEETIASGDDAILGPGLNIMRSPICGRNFEYFGEDPVLAGEIAGAYISGCQSTGAAACPKHFALNNQETCRRITSANIDERSMRELYLRGFEICIKKSKPWMLMTSYNRINGIFASEHFHVLKEILRDEWGFDGVTVSDWGAVHSAYATAVAGLDIEMAGGDGAWLNKPLKKLIGDGLLSENVLDEKVLRILRLLDHAGILDKREKYGAINTVEHRQSAANLACEGMVLLQNNGILPLNRNKLKKIVVTGPSADFQHDMGTLYMCGGSGAVHPEYEITPLAGLREYLGSDVEIIYAPEENFSHTRTIPEVLLRTDSGEIGLDAEYYADGKSLNDPDAKPLLRQVDKKLDFSWGNASAWVATVKDRESVLDDIAFSCRWHGNIVPDKCGSARIGIYQSGSCEVVVKIDGEIVLNNQDPVYSNGNTFHRLTTVAGEPIKIEILFKRKWSTAQIGLRILYLPETDFELDEVKDADAVLYFGGTNHLYDKEAIGLSVANEYADMPDMELPGNQNILIKKLCDLNPNTVVTLIGGSVVNVERWADCAPAILEAWYPGMESGRAIAKVLFGDAEPGGRLCCSWGRKLDDYPCHKYGLFPGTTDPSNSFSDYLEHFWVGYRYFDKEKIDVRYPFGHGNSYTTFTHKVTDVTVSGRSVSAAVEITNTGGRRGSDVIQLYVHDVESIDTRPEQELEGFEKITLDPGQSGKVIFKLTERDFSYFPGKGENLCFEPGRFELRFGTSSRAIFARKEILLN